MRFIAVFCLLCSSVAAQVEAVVIGPSGASQGDLVILDASQSKSAEHYRWTVIPKLSGDRLTILPIEEGKKCLLASLPGKYTVILAVAGADGIDLYEHTIVITGSSTPAPKPDDQDPDPQPNVINTRYGLTDLAARMMQQVSDKSAASAVADVFGGLSAQVSAGAIKDIDELQIETAKRNRQALGDTRDAWSEFFSAVQDELKDLAQSKKLDTLQDHAIAWKEIAAGIRRGQ